MLNYHELTMDESRDSPARRKQYVIICSVMAGAFAYTLLTAGVLESLNIYEGVFPSGEFIYKFTGRDYAASMSLVDNVADDIKLKTKDFEDRMYTLFLDDPNVVFGRQQRFASGVLLRSQTDAEDITAKTRLEALNKIKTRKPTTKEIKELAADELWRKLHYEFHDLPAVKAAVVQFPYNNGFVSALLFSYKIFPGLRKYAMEQMKTDIVPTVMTTCSIKESMCTHYVPLEQPEAFLLGRVDSAVHASSQTTNGLVNWEGVYSMFTNIATLGQGGGSKKVIHAKEEPKEEPYVEEEPKEEAHAKEETTEERHAEEVSTEEPYVEEEAKEEHHAEEEVKEEPYVEEEAKEEPHVEEEAKEEPHVEEETKEEPYVEEETKEEPYVEEETKEEHHAEDEETEEPYVEEEAKEDPYVEEEAKEEHHAEEEAKEEHHGEEEAKEEYRPEGGAKDEL